jgi:hypothetical protein
MRTGNTIRSVQFLFFPFSCFDSFSSFSHCFCATDTTRREDIGDAQNLVFKCHWAGLTNENISPIRWALLLSFLFHLRWILGKFLMYLLLSHLGRISRICAIERQIELVHLFIYVVDITFPSRWQKGGGTPSVNSTARHYPNPSLRNSLCCLW